MRRGAYAAGVFTASAFFLPAALAPGPITLAHGAATALALWLGFAVWRGHGRRDLPSSLPLRIFPVALGLTLSAATVFLAVIAGAWAKPGGPLLALVALLQSWWLFPASPVAMFTAAEPGLPPISEAAARLATLAATSALFAGIVFGFLTLIGAVSERESLHDHASIWKDGRAPDSAARLSDRGARGLRPVSDPLSTARRTPVSGRLWLRSLSLLVAFFCLLYAPVFARLVGGAQIPQVDAAFSASPLGGPFVTLWLIGLWGTCLSSALIFSAAYLRLGFALAR